MPTSGGRIHAEVRIGDSMVMMGDASPEWEPMPGSIHLYVDDADAAYKRALQAGATTLMEPADQDYGDRMAGAKDPFGNIWWIATPKDGAPTGELRQRAEASMARQDGG